jgi:hypothetical protein
MAHGIFSTLRVVEVSFLLKNLVTISLSVDGIIRGYGLSYE